MGPSTAGGKGKQYLKNINKYQNNFDFQTAEEAAQTGIYLACANEVKGITGEFFCNLKTVRKPPRITSKRLRNAIWTESEKRVNLQLEERIT